jgi:hypothetical protein
MTQDAWLRQYIGAAIPSFIFSKFLYLSISFPSISVSPLSIPSLSLSPLTTPSSSPFLSPSRSQRRKINQKGETPQTIRFLFMGTSSINFALLGGHGNTLNKERRQN